ncbi:MAG: hypothetical protein SCH70_01655 [Candidatus Methanoperedens sp.]|nr:hypothetical protein [Candidatus Methanoperedens sp.]
MGKSDVTKQFQVQKQENTKECIHILAYFASEMANEHNLRKGSEVTVEMIEDGSLLIKPAMETPAAPTKEPTGAANSPEKESQHVLNILIRP